MKLNFWNLFRLAKSEPVPADPLPEKLQEIIQFYPHNPNLFREAFIPRSAQQKNPEGESLNYERLEFLGDAMLGAVIAEFLFEKSPSQKEGYLTQMRSKIVSRKHLNEIGNNLGLVGFIPNEFKHKTSLSNDIAGDLFEALVGAIYEDQGFERTRNFIHRIVIEPYVNLQELENRITSYKSYVLEWAQKHKVNLEFNTFEEKNAEDITIFVSIVRLDNVVTAKGRGTSKKKAEENAAKRTYYSKQNVMS
ncbi:MAG: ribonuclease III [Flavobacteriaceae bacterium]|nr:ribonuclease III [Flavobacteriaceae bacterium]